MIDLAALIKDRLTHPRPMTINAHPEDMGMAILRQLTSGEAPGGKAALRMSSLGKCARALCYAVNDVPENGRSIDGRSRATFAMGDACEVLLSTALADSICATGWRMEGYREEGQISIDWEVDGHSIMGHPDGVLFDPDGQKHLLEIKSASSYGFSKWQKALDNGQEPWTPEESYWWQIQGYMAALDVRQAYILTLCKDSGAIMGWWHKADPGFGPMLKRHLELATNENPGMVPRQLPCGTQLRPVRKLSKKTGNPLKGDGALPWQCRYCNFYKTCHQGNLIEQVTRDYRGRPSTTLFLKEMEE